MVGLLCLIYMICSLRTNICFFIIFLTLVLAFGLLAGAYFNLALAYKNPTNTGAAAAAKKLVVVSWDTSGWLLRLRAYPSSREEGPASLSRVYPAGGYSLPSCSRRSTFPWHSQSAIYPPYSRAPLSAGDLWEKRHRWGRNTGARN